MMNPALSRAATTFLKGALLLTFFLFAPAPAGGAETGAVELTIGTILASNEGEHFDPKLARMKEKLKVFKYRSYRLVKEESQRVFWQTDGRFAVPGGRSLVVVPQHYRNKQVSLKVRLLEGEKAFFDTTVQLPNRGNFLLGGPKHDGGVLIILISAAAG